MSEPVLYVKKGCPYCAAAMEFLDERKIGYRNVEVRGDAAAMQKLQELSGQKRTPTMEWNGEVLADFGDVFRVCDRQSSV